MQYFDPEINEHYVPYVVETSIGLDRMFLAVLSSSFKEEKVNEDESRIVLKIPPQIAPVKTAILPLTKKDNLPEKAKEILNSLQADFTCNYEEKIQLEKDIEDKMQLELLFCITVDHETLENNTITLRNRDDMSQERVNISDLKSIILEKTSISNLF